MLKLLNSYKSIYYIDKMTVSLIPLSREARVFNT